MKYPLPEWEGRHPASPGNAGRRLYMIWGDEDRYRFGEMLRAEFPNVVMCEDLRTSEKWNPKEPPLVVLDRLDRSGKNRGVEICFPHPDWTPKRIYSPPKAQPDNPTWDFDQYWSPSMQLMTRVEPLKSVDWADDPAAPPVQVWRSIDMTTSYRKSIPRERLIENRVMTLAKKTGRKMVGIWWKSHDHFRRMDGFVHKGMTRYETCVASQAAIDWLRAAPGRALGLHGGDRGRHGTSWLPPEDVPDAFWGKVPKSKWVLEAIEARRKQGG